MKTGKIKQCPFSFGAFLTSISNITTILLLVAMPLISFSFSAGIHSVSPESIVHQWSSILHCVSEKKWVPKNTNKYSAEWKSIFEQNFLLYISNSSGITGRGQECPQRLLTGKFLLTFRETRGKEKRENGEKKGKLKRGRWKIKNGSRKKLEEKTRKGPFFNLYNLHTLCHLV